LELYKSPPNSLLEDLVVGLLVDTVRDLLVVLVAEAGLVSGVVNLCKRLSASDEKQDVAVGGYERLVTCLSAKPCAALLPLRESLALSMSPDIVVVLVGGIGWLVVKCFRCE
jgi:hypothetical protein